MSASRDRSQKVAFIYSNLYEVYQKNKKAHEFKRTTHDEVPGTTTGRVIKAGQLNAKVESYRPMEFIRPDSNQAVNDMKQNLENLENLSARMQFMLKELEDLIK